MRNQLTKMAMIAGLALFAGGAFGIPPIKAADEAEATPDAKKKKAGEACKASDECQRHHTCSKVGDKNICVASPRPDIPPPT